MVNMHPEMAHRQAAAREWSDNVTRMHDFTRDHPGVSVLLPRQSDSGEFEATWVEDSNGDGYGGPMVKVSDPDLGRLMNKLEDMFRGR